MIELTEKQAKLHSFLCERWNDPPTVRELCSLMGISLNAVNGHLAALVKKGYIELPGGKRSRGIKVLIGPNLDGAEIEVAGRMYRLQATEGNHAGRQ